MNKEILFSLQEKIDNISTKIEDGFYLSISNTIKNLYNLFDIVSLINQDRYTTKYIDSIDKLSNIIETSILISRVSKSQ